MTGSVIVPGHCTDHLHTYLHLVIVPMPKRPMDPPDIAGGDVWEDVREVAAVGYLTHVDQYLEQWKLGSMDPQRALAKIRKTLAKAPAEHPTLTPILQWENQAHEFKRDMTKTLSRAWWHLLAVLRPAEEWPLAMRRCRDVVIQTMVRHVRLIFFELEEVDHGRLPDDHVGRGRDVKEHMDMIDNLFARCGIPREPAKPVFENLERQAMDQDVFRDLLESRYVKVPEHGGAPGSGSKDPGTDGLGRATSCTGDGGASGSGTKDPWHAYKP